MRRIVLFAMSTLTVLVLLFGYHTSTSGDAATAKILALADHAQPLFGRSDNGVCPAAEAQSAGSNRD